MWTAEQFISVGLETDYRITLQVVSIHINHNLHQLIQRARTVIGDQDFLA